MTRNVHGDVLDDVLPTNGGLFEIFRLVACMCLRLMVSTRAARHWKWNCMQILGMGWNWICMPVTGIIGMIWNARKHSFYDVGVGVGPTRASFLKKLEITMLHNKRC